MSNEQVHIEADDGDLSRSEVILKGALAAGAVYGALAVGPYVRRALGAMGGGDVDIVNFALTLEYLEAKFYAEAKGRVRGNSELRGLIDLLAKDEQQHVEALAATVKQLGGKPVAEPKFDFAYSGTSGFLKLAQTFEDTGVSAYNGAGPLIKSKEVLAAAGGIVQVEARHAAAVRLQNGEEPAPMAFDEPLSEKQVLKAVEPFLA
ncbi:MAG: ferritin-like domain-containing protein [Actinomycetota bacterium]|nr:ferritin-like domain-containing protein [Actinomycetota bacterium]